MRHDTLWVDLGLDATNDDLIEQMRTMKAAREGTTYRHVIATVRGFGDDPRPLFDIPEVRAFARRLVTLGLISYLDYSTVLDPRQPAENKVAWGAAEAWICAEGLAPGGQIRVTPQLLDDIERAVAESNAAADARLGPMREPS
jgi:hypothetical protein